MSGGALGYFYNRIDEPFHEMKKYYYDQYCPLHGHTPDPVIFEIMQRFFKKIHLLQHALHDIEWVMSGDYGCGGEIKAIKEFLEEE